MTHAAGMLLYEDFQPLLYGISCQTILGKKAPTFCVKGIFL